MWYMNVKWNPAENKISLDYMGHMNAMNIQELFVEGSAFTQT